LAEQKSEADKRKQELGEAIAAFEGRTVQYSDLIKENNGLKQDLYNLSVQLKKTERDQAGITQRQEEVDERATQLAERYLAENVSWIADKLNPNNFATCKKRLLKVVERCRSIGFDIPAADEDKLIQDLRQNFEKAVRDEFHREEQARIRAQIREEEKLAREIEKQTKEAEREQAAIQAALEKALAETKDEHSAEAEHLRAKLKEAQEKAERAKSQAQMTKSGHVYILSNIGSFGEGVYKIGMTRRLQPNDRVRELGDASVPFPFDVHMMVSCDDAPSLENTLHRELHRQRVNKVNLRKEYFRIDFDTLRQAVQQHHGDVDYVAEPEALQFRETLEMSDEDQEFIEETVQAVFDDEEDAGADE